MTAHPEPQIRTGMVKAANLPLHELLSLRESGDTALDHCLQRVAKIASSGSHGRVAAFNASPPRPPRNDRI
jgi:hypothetical protein